MGKTAKKGKITIYDIAREAGVSTATVSRVINHSPSVDYETRRRVIELCAKLNYRPRIVKNKEPHVGVLIEHHVQLQMGLSDYFAGIVSGATEYAYQQKLELSVLLFESEDLRNPEDVVSFLLEKDVSGAIFVAPPVDADYIYALHRIGFPYLSIASRFQSQRDQQPADGQCGRGRQLRALSPRVSGTRGSALLRWTWTTMTPSKGKRPLSAP